jgi:hypothetical protein
MVGNQLITCKQVILVWSREVKMVMFPRLHRGMSRFVYSRAFLPYVAMGTTCGLLEAGNTFSNICYDGLPRYAKIAVKDPTGILNSTPAYGVATMATISTVGVVTAIAWPVRLSWFIGEIGKSSTEYSVRRNKRRT